MNRMIEQQLKSNKIKWILVSSISFFFFFCNSFSRHYRAPLLFMSAFQYNKLLHGISMYRSNKGFIRQFHCVIFLLLCVVVNFPHTNCINERLPGRSIRYCSVSARTLFGNFARAKTSPIGCGQILRLQVSSIIHRDSLLISISPLRIDFESFIVMVILVVCHRIPYPRFHYNSNLIGLNSDNEGNPKLGIF